jgi:hypothetical protein
MLRRADGTWTASVPVPHLDHLTSALSLFSMAPGKFVLREYHRTYSWERKKHELIVHDQVLTVRGAKE